MTASTAENTTAGKTRFMPFPMALIVWSSLALFFLLVSWAAGGDRFKANNYGDFGLYAPLATLIIGLVLHFAKRDR